MKRIETQMVRDVIPIQRKRLVDEATRVADAILNGKLVPGMRLRQVELAQQLGISRTPLREALMKLEQEGLIESRPRGGLSVVALKFEEAIELYEIREMLDGLAASLAARKINQGTIELLHGHLKKMEKCLKKQNPHEWFVHHVAFHEGIMEASQNGRLMALVSNIRLSIQRFHPVLLTTPNRLKRAFQEHAAIFNAIKRGDAKAAERLARLHIANAREIIIKLSAGADYRSEGGQRQRE